MIKTQNLFDVNIESLKSFATVWEAYKARCRGWLINFAELEAALFCLFFFSFFRSQSKSRLIKKKKFNLYHFYSKCFENGDKARGLLALRLQKATNS